MVNNKHGFETEFWEVKKEMMMLSEMYLAYYYGIEEGWLSVWREGNTIVLYCNISKWYEDRDEVLQKLANKGYGKEEYLYDLLEAGNLKLVEFWDGSNWAIATLEVNKGGDTNGYKEKRRTDKEFS